MKRLMKRLWSQSGRHRVVPLLSLSLVLGVLMISFGLGVGCGSGQPEGPQKADWIKGDFPSDLPRPENGVATLRLAGQEIRVEVAASSKGRNYGLMFVEELPDDRGMLFVYPKPQTMNFWMRNTRIPLDIAFIAELGPECKVVNVRANMRPYQESPSYSSMGKCRFALELPGGWAERHGLKAGDLVDIPKQLRSMQVEVQNVFQANLPRRIGP